MVPYSALAADGDLAAGMLMPKFDVSASASGSNSGGLPKLNRSDLRMTEAPLPIEILVPAPENGDKNQNRDYDRDQPNSCALQCHGPLPIDIKLESSAEAAEKKNTLATSVVGEGSTNNADGLQKMLYGWRSTLAVAIETPVNTKSAYPTQMVEARLAQDFRFGNNLIASQNSLVRGHIVDITSPRTLSKAAGSSDRRFNSRACLVLQFDELIDQNGRRWPIVAKPCMQDNITNSESSPSHLREVKVDRQGRIVKAEAALTKVQKNTFNAARVATMLPLPTTVLMNVVGVPAVLGVAGAASPSFAYNKPVEAKNTDTRAKAAAYAFITNVPGAFFVQSVVEKGDQIVLLPGDQLVLDVSIRESGYRYPTTTATATALSVSGSVVTPDPVRRYYPVNPKYLSQSASIPASNSAPR